MEHITGIVAARTDEELVVYEPTGATHIIPIATGVADLVGVVADRDRATVGQICKRAADCFGARASDRLLHANLIPTMQLTFNRSA